MLVGRENCELCHAFLVIELEQILPVLLTGLKVASEFNVTRTEL